MQSDNILEPCPNVFFGPYSYTYEPECITRMRAVINVDTEEQSTSPVASQLRFRHWPTYDRTNYPILKNHLRDVLEFIDTVDGPVYIHCYMGCNRSAALAIAVAILRTHEPADAIIARMQAQTSRPLLDNTGFVKQLRELK